MGFGRRVRAGGENVNSMLTVSVNDDLYDLNMETTCAKSTLKSSTVSS